jgi:hypothetical protein
VSQRRLVTLFKNGSKVNNPKSPDWVGQGIVEIGHKLYPARVVAWQRNSEKAGDYLNVDIEVGYDHDPSEPENS